MLANQTSAVAAAPAIATREHYEIVPVTEIPEAALAQFYHRAYPARAAFLAAYWRWLYRVGEFAWAPTPQVAMVGQTVVGHLGAIPVLLQAGQEVQHATWDLDFAVLPEYQRRKLGLNLLQALMKQSPLHVAFGNEKSTNAALRVGWRLDTQTRSFQLLLHPECHPKFQHPALAPVGWLGGLLTRLIWAARTTAGGKLTVAPATADNLARFAHQPIDETLHVVRSTEFLDWRVLRHPRAAAHCVLRYPVNATTEYALLARRSEQQGYRRLHLLSLVAEPFDAAGLARCFASVVRWCLAEEIHRVLFVTSRPAIAQVAQSWFPIASALQFLGYAHDSTGWDYLHSRPHHWECLDADLDLYD
jgi:GNAT superfamily N-acetyltransferase